MPTIDAGTMSGISVVFKSIHPPTAVPMSAAARKRTSMNIHVF